MIAPTRQTSECLNLPLANHLSNLAESSVRHLCLHGDARLGREKQKRSALALLKMIDLL
jgi:hypothetical protein